MKKLYTLALTALLCALHAQAAVYHINVDDASRVVVAVNNAAQTIVSGDNDITIGSWQRLVIKGAEGCVVTDVCTPSGSHPLSASGGEWSTYVMSASEEVSLVVTSALLSDARTEHCTVAIDNPAKARVRRSLTGEYLTLEAGDNDVAFMPAESPFTISAANYGDALYQVLLNGEALPTKSSYSVAVKAGDRLEVKADFPDEDVAVSFNFASGDAACIKAISVDGTEAQGFDGKTLSVKIGSNVKLTFDQDNYKIDYVSIDGQKDEYIYGEKTFRVMAATSVEVSATKYEAFTATFSIDDPARATLYRGYDYEGNVIALEAGENTVEFNTKNPYFSLKPTDGNYIAALTADGETLDHTLSEIKAEAGKRYDITTGAIVRDKQCAIWVDNADNKSLYNLYLRLNGASKQSKPQTGYQVLNFYDGDVPAQIYAYGYGVSPKLYCGDEELTGSYGSWRVTFEDGKAYKLYIESEPQLCTVSVEATGVESTALTVVRDSIVGVPAWTDGFTALQQTRVRLTPAEAGALDITVDGEQLTPDQDGACTFDVEKNTTLRVAHATGIRTATTTGQRTPGAIYNLQGQRVARPAHGLYIQDGRKVAK